MKNLEIESTARTPYIKMDSVKGEIEFAGRSIPEDSVDFYSPVFLWLEEYARHKHKSTVFRFKLEYINTSSSKCMLNIFEMIEQMYQNGWNVKVIWCEDEDGLEWDFGINPFTFPLIICDSDGYNIDANKVF